MKKIFLAITVSFLALLTACEQNKTEYKNLKEALLNPGQVISLSLGPQSIENAEKAKHLPAELVKLINLKVLNISCLKNLEDLPEEIGNLKSLENLNIDEGNGCQMNISLPSSIGQLSNLKVLNLRGALDNRYSAIDSVSKEQFKIKKLPKSISNLQNLEELDLSRNGLHSVPSQVYSLKKLKILKLGYNEIYKISDSISNLTNLKELSLIIDSITNLPESMKMLKGLKVIMDDYYQKPVDQKRLQEKFPNIIFEFVSPE